ncbi:DNA replication and repair protein RecF [Candidatus Gracilibacteria bacterium]|nr:DNA replication and repair protein RecF [Candidatus Gracilibacteria bacterium]
MKLLSLRAQNFRNLTNLELDFNKPVNTFVGNNAQGKTNILEAITLLAFGKSLRSNSEKSLREIGTDFFRVEGLGEKSNEKKVRIEIAADVNQKTFKLNRKPIIASQLVGNFPVVSFAPENLNLLLLSPSLRRRYLDILLSQTSRKYLLALSSYSKALKNRNALLARIAENLAKEEELEFWDEELAKHGSLIGKLRAEFLEFAEQPLAENFQKIANEAEELRMQIANFHGEEISERKYLENLGKLREKDLRYANTNYGIHRADLIFRLENEPLAENGSRGEIRSTILALKFVELAFIEEQLKEKPVLLLDDVFSELDAARQKSLMSLIHNHQTFITTTKIAHLDLIEKKDVWEVKNGSVEKILR